MYRRNFVEIIRASIRENWDLPALSNYREDSISYGKVADRLLWFHYIFEKSGVKKGDKISLLGRNSANWAIVYLATVTYGAAIVPILPDFHTSDFHHIVNHSDSIFLFVADNIYDKMDESKMTKLEAIFSLQNFDIIYAKRKSLAKIMEKADNQYLEKLGGPVTRDNFVLPTINNDHLAGVLYTSGTSGFSKGVMLPHNSLAANVDFARNSIALKSGHAILSFLPNAHTFGCTFDFLFPFSVGCHITFLSQIPSPKILIQAMEQIKPHLILSVPLVIEKIYRKNIKPKLDKASIKLLTLVPGVGHIILNKIRTKLIEVFGGRFIEIVIGGAALNEEVETFLKKINFPYTCGYGMTECGPLISYKPWAFHKRGSVGQLIYTMELRIDSQVTGATDGSGEIQVRGENVMMGYYKNEEATEAVFTPDGWLHTGDIGVIDKDGYIYLKGRHKSMLLGPSGQNIYPEEIEARLNNLPYVEESLVIEKDKKIVALVYPNMETVDAEHLSIDELNEKMNLNLETLNSLLPVYSKVSRIELFPQEFEKTPTKKIKRFLYTISHG